MPVRKLVRGRADRCAGSGAANATDGQCRNSLDRLPHHTITHDIRTKKDCGINGIQLLQIHAGLRRPQNYAIDHDLCSFHLNRHQHKTKAGKHHPNYRHGMRTQAAIEEYRQKVIQLNKLEGGVPFFPEESRERAFCAVRSPLSWTGYSS